MKILSKYVLKEHVGPFTFALTALTSLMLLNFISRQFGELVGKGLPWSVIGEFFLLSIPFTVALTLPMSVLVAVLYAFSRLAAENEVTALRASGVSPWRLVSPAIAGGVVMSLALLAFNDQVLPRANHRLKTLQDDISQAKPTFLLKDQVINPIAEGKFYLKAGKIDRASGRMREVVIYDLADPQRRRTIYADQGSISLAANRTDLDLDLFHGQMQEVGTDKPGQLDRLFFEHDHVRIRNVARDFKKTESETASKGDREMSVCEMQRRLWLAETGYRDAQREFDDVKAGRNALTDRVAAPPPVRAAEPRGIGWAYCTLVNRIFGVRQAHAADLASMTLHAIAAQDTVRKKDSIPRGDTSARRDTTRRRDSIVRSDTGAARFNPFTRFGRRRDSANAAARGRPDLRPPGQRPAIIPQLPPAPVRGGATTAGASGVARAITTSTPDTSVYQKARTAEAKLRVDIAKRARNRFDIEIHKKFSLAAACLIFVLLGAPIAVRFPRGGVGLVIGVSLVVFALYYVGLIGGESLANEGYLPPFWAMWGTNVILTAVGVVLLARMGRDATGRGGDVGDRIGALFARFGRGSRAQSRP